MAVFWRLSFALMSICTLLLVSKPLSAFLNKLSERHHSLQIQVERALESSNAPLEIAFNYLKLNDTFQQNLTWNLKNSIEGHLTGLIKNGQVDDVRLLSADCHVLFESKTAISVNPLPCEPLKLGGAFLWVNDKNALIYSFAGKTLDGANPLYALTSVKIANAWFKVHSLDPEIVENWKFPALTENPEKQFGIISLNLTGGLLGYNQAYIEAPLPYIKWLKMDPLKIVRRLEKANDIGLGLLLFGILILLLLVKKYNLEIEKQNTHITKSLQKLLASATSEGITIETIDDNSQYGNLATEKLNEKTEILELFTQFESIANKESLSRGHLLNSFKIEKAHLESQIATLSNECKFYQELAINNILSKSMQLRLGKFLKILVKKLGEYTHEPQLMTEIIESTILSKINMLQSQLNTWTREIDSRGSRKFIRSLAESQPKNPKYDNLLSETLSTFILDHSTLYLETEKLHKKLISFSDIPSSLISVTLSYMYYFSEEEKSRNIKSPLSKTIEKAQQETKHLFPQKVTFLPQTLPLPFGQHEFQCLDYLTTAIFSHIFSFLLLCDPYSVEPIIISVKHKEKSPLVVLSRKGSSTLRNEVLKMHDEKNFDYHVANILSKHVGAKLEFIPTGENVAFIIRFGSEKFSEKPHKPSQAIFPSAPDTEATAEALNS